MFGMLILKMKQKIQKWSFGKVGFNLNKLFTILMIVSVTGIIFSSSTSQQAFAGGHGSYVYQAYLQNLHKKIIPHGTTPPPTPPPCNIDKYHHCSAPVLVCFTVTHILVNAGISPDVIRQVAQILNCS